MKIPTDAELFATFGNPIVDYFAWVLAWIVTTAVRAYLVGVYVLMGGLRWVVFPLCGDCSIALSHSRRHLVDHIPSNLPWRLFK